MSTTDRPAGDDPKDWRLDTDNGSLVPRSALDVLVDLNENLASGRYNEYQPIPLGFPMLGKLTPGTGCPARSDGHYQNPVDT